MAENKASDLRKIEEIIEIMKINDLVEVEIKHGDHKILVKRSQPQQPTIAAVPMVNSHPITAAVPPSHRYLNKLLLRNSGTDENLVEIKSPMVGTFYSSASPDSESYVEKGSHVDSQTVICIVEAMKVMNELKAETSGTIVEILVTSGQAVEYGQVLFRVQPD